MSFTIRPYALGDRADVVADRTLERRCTPAPRPDRHLPHVHVGQRRHRAARRRRRSSRSRSCRPRATTARPSSGSIARSTSSPPAPIIVPAASCSPSSGAADHDAARDRQAARAPVRAPENAASSAASLSARPSQRAPASAARSVTRAKLSQLHMRALPSCRLPSAHVRSGPPASRARSRRRSSARRSRSRPPPPPRAARTLDDVGLDATDVVEPVEVLVHRHGRRRSSRRARGSASGAPPRR